MATSQIVSSLLRPTTLTQNHQNQIPILPIHTLAVSKAPFSFKVQAAKLPSGLIVPKVEPKLTPPFLGFTKIAETWNSRACMIGLIGTFIVELILGKGILQIIGVDVGKGLDLPL